MNRKIIPFTNEEAWLNNRKNDLTSSDIPCLFSCGYQSYESLLNHKKNGTSPKYDPDERKQWGVALQDAIANEFARQNNWTIRKKQEYIRIPELRIGSSFDFEISHEDKHFDVTKNELLEIKNVDQFIYKKEWMEGFETEASLYIELQLQHELLVSGLKSGYIGALIGGNKGKLLRREASSKIQSAILMKAERFWKEVGS